MSDSDKPLLSICIPTYNRDYLIEQLLKKICPIVEKYHGIEIVVSDNSSPDNTKKVIESFKEKYNFIVYYNQKKNIGPDKNFEFVLKYAKGTYRWLLGDGCFFEEEGLVNLLSILSKNYSVIVLGMKSRTDNLCSTYYHDANSLLSDLGWHMTLLSCLVYNECVIIESNFKRYYDSFFIQEGIIFEYFAQHPCNLFFENKIKIYAFSFSKRDTWLSKSIYIFCKKWYEFIFSLPVFYLYESKIKCVKDHDKLTGLFSLFGLMRLRCYYNLSISDVLTNSFFVKQVILLPYFLVVFVSLLPRSILKFIHKLQVQIRRIQK